MAGSLEAGAFDPAAVDSETAAFNASLEAALAAAPSLLEQRPEQVRAARERGESIWGPVVTVPEASPRTIRHLGRSVPVRVLSPPSRPPVGVYLHLHGGGWTLGAAHHSDVRNRQISRLGLTVVSADYRLAPEHPYPAGPDDCEAVADWLLEGGAAELAGGGWPPLAIGGESAGAHLALVTLLRLRERRGATGFSAANLVYGCYDLALTPGAELWGERNLVLSTPILRWFFAHFLQGAHAGSPDVSPLRADLRELPPALLTAGTLDPLIDDSLFLFARWLAAGSRAELALYPGGVHGFNALPIGLAKAANERIDAFLLRQLRDH
jgi:acetyl esterase/lipase